MGSILAAPVRNQLLSRAGNADYRVGCSQMQGFRPEMEDAHNIVLNLDGHPDVALFAVYDGHAGEMVAKYLARELPGHIAKLERLDDESLQAALLAFDANVGQKEFKNMGSTCVLALVRPESSTSADAKEKSYHITVVNVGDSRAMIVRANGRLVSLTEDHKPDDRKESRRIRAAGGTVSNNRVDGGLAMSRAIGDYTYKQDTARSELEQKVIALPDVTHGTASAGDRLLVICDGVVERLSNSEVAAYVHAKHKKGNQDPAEVMRELLLYSLARGSTDNQSAILIAFEDGTGYEQPDQFIAGPMSEWASDRKFVNAYLKNAQAWGITLEEIAPLIAEADAKTDKDWRNVSKPDDGGTWTASAPFLMLLFVALVCYVVMTWETRAEPIDFDGM